MRKLIPFLIVLPLFAADGLIPLAEGNQWTYEQRFFDFKGKLESTDTLLLSIDAAVEHKGRVYYEYRWQGAEQADLLFQGEDGIYLGGKIIDDMIEFYDSPVLYLKYPINQNEYFVDKANNIRYECTGENLRAIPSGKYNTLRFLVYDIESNTPTAQEYAPGIGLVYVEILGQWMEIRLVTFDVE